ncbi:hypothetical protein [Paenibacillus xylanilyticus]|uniref:hypothetical protein n=1 Tax=Paenibacillus xylanilyticus TaxID=248903 RepID=UPI0039A30DF0
MKTFLLILGVILFGLGVRGIIVGLVHGLDGSFLLYKSMSENMEMYANILFIIISIIILSISKTKKRLEVSGETSTTRDQGN